MNNSSPLRVGVIGLGYAGTAHLRSFARIPDVRIVALAGREEARLHELGREFFIPTLLGDWEDLVAVPELDVVSIATPNVLHAPIAIAALKAGKHVFCEKPLAINGDEARQMVAAAHEHDRVLEVAFNHRRRGDIRLSRRHIVQPGLGRIYHVRASWKRRAGIPGHGTWFTNRKAAGGGALIDLGPHVLDSVLHLLGEPRVVTASAVAHGELGRSGRGFHPGTVIDGGVPSFDVEDLASALLRLDDGSSIALEISWAAHAVDEEEISIELLGVDAGIRIFVPSYRRDDTVRIYSDVDGEPAVIAPEVPDAGEEHPLVVAEFVDIVRSGDWSAHHGDSALHRTEVLDACYRSAALGREVVL